jgi:CRISPR/Cas system Type II protein with McrA/HNH and RuvC-like nuclease domain
MEIKYGYGVIGNTQVSKTCIRESWSLTRAKSSIFFVCIEPFVLFKIFIIKSIMKEKILKLREEGKSYKQIQLILNCSKSTISYHCGEGQKEKTKTRTKQRRENTLLEKVERFKYRKFRNNREKVRRFNKRDNENGFTNKVLEHTFFWTDVLNKFGENTVCYLSGEKINLLNDSYSLDHIIPHSRGGDNSLDNLGITHEIVNKMKSDLNPDELIIWCKKILEFNGYKIIKG